jgi:hypothetical protein
LINVLSKTADILDSISSISSTAQAQELVNQKPEEFAQLLKVTPSFIYYNSSYFAFRKLEMNSLRLLKRRLNREFLITILNHWQTLNLRTWLINADNVDIINKIKSLQ